MDVNHKLTTKIVHSESAIPKWYVPFRYVESDSIALNNESAMIPFMPLEGV